MMVDAPDLRHRVDAEGLDPGIRNEVMVLRQFGVETYESCQGGEGHAYPEPTVRFHGDPPEGLRAFAVAQWQGLRVWSLRRVWDVVDGELNGPHWEMAFLCETNSKEAGQ